MLTGVLLLGGCTGSTASEDPIEEGVVSGQIPSGSGSGNSAPTIDLSASELTVSEGSSTTLSWNATGADACTASGGWSGTLDTSGSLTVGPLSSGTTFTLNCTGAGGSALQMISVAVVGPVALSWVAPAENVDGSALTDLAGYRIYFGNATRSYSDMVEVGNPAATSHTLNLASGDYYLAMTALDADGNESGYSNEVLRTRL
ncbi:MAG: hypothetical protein AB7I04_17045 [Pseudomonadales bacterium]